jgi:hypothetical protein
MTDNERDPQTGPSLFLDSVQEIDAAFNECTADSQRKTDAIASAQVSATQAQVAALVLLAEINALAYGVRSRELEVWREVLPAPPLVECWSKEKRRPECSERHTEDCTYADPVPEPEHVLLPVGTRVLVSDWEREEDMWGDSYTLRLKNPEAGRISGYDMRRTKYRWQKEWEPGRYASCDSWAFADNRVEVHPDGPETGVATEGN